MTDRLVSTTITVLAVALLLAAVVPAGSAPTGSPNGRGRGLAQEGTSHYGPGGIWFNHEQA